jgi:hypothetical protein
LGSVHKAVQFMGGYIQKSLRWLMLIALNGPLVGVAQGFAGQSSSPIAPIEPHLMGKTEKTVVQNSVDAEGRVRDFLNQMPVIRVAVSYGGGSGHESAGATIVTRLRQIGYNGNIEVVYENRTKEKLIYLFPPFRSELGLVQNFPELKLKFYPLTQFMHSSYVADIEPVDLVISGAKDGVLSASTYMAKMALQLQPLKWARGSTLAAKLNIEDPDAGRFASDSEGLGELRGVGYAFDLPHPGNIESFIHNNMDHDAGLAKKTSGLISILKYQEFNDLLPVYGHQIAAWDRSQLIRLQRGLSLTLRSFPNATKGKMVVPIFNSVPYSAADIEMHMKNGQYTADEFYVASIDDPNLNEKCRDLKKGAILFVLVGSVSKPIFEYIYNRATLPPIVEGMNSINLMQIIGKPYLPSAPHEGFHFVKPSDKHLWSGEDWASYDQAKSAFDYFADPESAVDVEQFAKFVAQSSVTSSASSSMWRFFQKQGLGLQGNLGDRALINSKDKFFQALLKLEKLVPKWESRWEISLVPKSQIQRCEQIFN